VYSLTTQDRDADERIHVISIQLPPNYPDVVPRVSVDMPLAFESKWPTLASIVQQCEAVSARIVGRLLFNKALQRLELFLPVWRVLDEIDKRFEVRARNTHLCTRVSCLVLDPSGVPPRAALSRRIALGEYRTLSLVIDVHAQWHRVVR
jgi:hypothetical protein